VALSPRPHSNKLKVVLGSDDQTVRMWYAASSGRQLKKLESNSRSVNSVAFSPDGSKAVSEFDSGISISGVGCGQRAVEETWGLLPVGFRRLVWPSPLMVAA
jgi:WD40 repeat protein